MSTEFSCEKNYGIIRGQNFMFLLDDSRTLYGCGRNRYGQLGTGDSISREKPTEIMKNVKKVIVDGNVTLILDDSNSLFICGFNNVGFGNFNNKNCPVKIIENVKDFLCDGSCLFVITFSNEIFVLGNNSYGQLALRFLNISYTFTQLNITNVISISNGMYHTLFLTDEGVFATGCNCTGELGLGDYEDRNTITKIKDLTNIVRIWTGLTYSLALDNEGNIFSFGHNYYGQLGLGDNENRNTPTKIDITNVKNVYLGIHHLFIETSNKLFASGCNRSGELGVGDYNHRNLPTEVMIGDVKKIVCANAGTYLLCMDGQLYWTGDNGYANLIVGFENWNTFIKILDYNVLDFSHSINTLVLTESGNVVDISFNPHGILELNDNRNVFTEIDFPGEIYQQPQKLYKNANK